MNIKKALIVYKKSAYQTYFQEYRDPVYRRLSKKGDKILAHIKRSHGMHYESVRSVEQILKSKNVSYDKKPRGQRFKGDKYDLVISVGGDGTFLDAARHVRKTPLLGVNSDIHYSVGRFCSTDLASFEKVFNRILRGRASFQKINRLQISINGKPWPFPVLNDLLACHSSPAAMSHYVIRIGAISERQRGSGVWIATAAGSTGAVKSAGGRVLPFGSDNFQYVPREIFEGHGVRPRLRGGVLKPSQHIVITSQMQPGMLYVDGAHTRIPWRFGDILTVKPSKYPLLISVRQ